MEQVYYQNKSDIIEAGLDVASRELVTEYVNDFYVEKDQQLIIIGRDALTRMYQDVPNELYQVDKETYKVRQENMSDMDGYYMLTVEFSWLDDDWKITDRMIEPMNQPY